MDEDDKTPVEEEEQKGNEAGPHSVTRRQFLVGAGAGLVAGAAGAAGVISIVAPKVSVPVAQPVISQPNQPAQVAQATSSLTPNMRQVTLNVDGKDYDITVDVRMSLWEVLTYQLGMANSNVGCDRSQCGACAVVIDGRAVNSCNMLAARLGRGQKILTVDSLTKGTHPTDLHPIQIAFQEEGAFQCGLCTRGLIMSTYAFLTKNPNPTETEVREALSGNICRCSTYPKIYEAVFRAADDMRKKA